MASRTRPWQRPDDGVADSPWQRREKPREVARGGGGGGGAAEIPFSLEFG